MVFIGILCFIKLFIVIVLNIVVFLDFVGKVKGFSFKCNSFCYVLVYLCIKLWLFVVVLIVNFSLSNKVFRVVVVV